MGAIRVVCCCNFSLCHYAISKINIQFITMDVTFLLLNTMRPRRNGQHFADDIFKRIFFSENVWISIKFHCSLFLGIQLTILQHWFRYVHTISTGAPALYGTGTSTLAMSDIGVLVFHEGEFLVSFSSWCYTSVWLCEMTENAIYKCFRKINLVRRGLDVSVCAPHNSPHIAAVVRSVSCH